MKKTIYDLELHEVMELTPYWAILRVPEGWIYSFATEKTIHQTFAPYSNEFNTITKN